MALKCTSDDGTIYSFKLNNDEWASMKSHYKNQNLKMTCCDTLAIPKTSKLGTPFFAHKNKGECSSAGETKEHIMAKYIVASVLHKLGWNVDIEVNGVTPSGKTWIADIFATKDKAKIAIEIQWSPQTITRTRERQEIYAESGVRCAWLMRCRKNQKDAYRDYQDDITLPVFGFYLNDSNDGFNIPRFELDLKDFIANLMTSKIKWTPKENETGYALPIIMEETCWKCKKDINVVAKIELQDNSEDFVGYLDIDNPSSIKVINHIALESTFFIDNKIGELKESYSNRRKGKYFSNNCFYCGAIQGSFYINKMYREAVMHDCLPEPTFKFPFLFSKKDSHTFGKWKCY